MEDNFLSQLGAMAVQVHEMYAEYVKAGFTEEQAMQLIQTTLAIALGGNKGSE